MLLCLFAEFVSLLQLILLLFLSLYIRLGVEGCSIQFSNLHAGLPPKQNFLSTPLMRKHNQVCWRMETKCDRTTAV